MLRKYILPAAGLVVAAAISTAQPPAEEPFGVLRGTPPAPTSGASAGLPPGVEAAAPTNQPAYRPSTPRPRNPFPLTSAAGEWLICAAHYSGPDGFNLAHQVAIILRDKHRLPVYILDRGEEERKKQEAEWKELRKQYPQANLRLRMPRVEDQYAVLVGGYKDLATANAALPRVRSLPMPQLKLDGGRSPYETMFYSDATEDKKGMVMKTATINPFTQAIAVRNPMVPPSAKQKWDPFWKTLNADEEYSLLRNPKKYTFIVKEYLGGGQVISGAQPARATGILGGLGGAAGAGGNSAGDVLAASQAQAHELAKVLRHPQMGFEAYVLHMRTGSIVTVGGFDGPDDPKVATVLRRLKALKFNNGPGGTDPVGLKAIPQMAEVPRF
jgi:hypothetical protein